MPHFGGIEAKRPKGMSVQMIALRSIVPNRYRHIESYKLSETKLEALIQSYESSGFWDGSIQARPHPSKADKFEIAFGHHRVEAAKRAGLTEIGLVLAPRSDADMLRMMADENREEFRSDALVAVETIAAVIEAYERGEIELEEPKKEDAGKREVFPGGKTYTLTTVARFLGWVKPSTGQAINACRQAFDAYRERASIKDALDTIPSEQRSGVAVETVRMAATAARKAGEQAGLSPAKIRQAEQQAAKTAAHEVRERTGFRAKDLAVGIGQAEVSRVVTKRVKQGPPVEFYIGKLIHKCEQAEPYNDILAQCQRLTPFVDDLDPEQTRKLATALEAMLKRTATKVRYLVDALRAQKPTALRKALEA